MKLKWISLTNLRLCISYTNIEDNNLTSSSVFSLKTSFFPKLKEIIICILSINKSKESL